MATALQKIYKGVAAITADPRRQPFFSAASLLFAFSKLYQAMVAVRQCLYRHGWLPTHRLACPVIAVGNIEVGGTGKTPMTIYLAELLRNAGLRPVIISRGYRGKGGPAGGIVSDGRTIGLDAGVAGDEPYLMANLLAKVPVVIGKDRYLAGLAAIRKFKPDVILLDDAFQHMRLWRDLNILLMDSEKPLGNGYMLPRGRLREPPRAALRSSAVVLTRSGEKAPPYFPNLCRALSPRPVFRARHRVVVREIVPSKRRVGQIDSLTSGEFAWADEPLFAFSGLARNDRFIDSLKNLGMQIAGRMGFGDHHRYSDRDLERIVSAAKRRNCNRLVTTDKDFVRLPAGTLPDMDLIVVGVRIDFGEDAGPWNRFVTQHVDRCLKNM